MIFLVASNVLRAIGSLALNLYYWNYCKLLYLNTQLKLNARKKSLRAGVNLCKDGLVQCSDPV